MIRNNLPRKIPAEPLPIRLLNGLAPKFSASLVAIMMDMAALGWPCIVRETLRTNERQSWLYGFGRWYDDGRGIVTSVLSAFTGWHFFGLAADLVHASYGDNAPDAFYLALEKVAERHNCRTGLRWKTIPGGDGKHVQWGPCRVSPSWRAKALYLTGGNLAVWKAVGAN